jgi:hypothetical protein
MKSTITELFMRLWRIGFFHFHPGNEKKNPVYPVNPV